MIAYAFLEIEFAHNSVANFPTSNAEHQNWFFNSLPVCLLEDLVSSNIWCMAKSIEYTIFQNFGRFACF